MRIDRLNSVYKGFLEVEQSNSMTDVCFESNQALSYRQEQNHQIFKTA